MDSDAISDSVEDKSEPLVSQHMCSGLEALWQAAKYAHNADVDLWNFAVEIDEIRGAGLVASDLRWLVAKGYVEHASEIDAESADRRCFENNHRFRFTANSCFVLTPLGIDFVRLGLLEPLRAASGQAVDFQDAPTSDTVPHAVPPAVTGGNSENQTPHWDSARRELWVGPTLIKQFRVPAPRQEIVLTVFEEENWPGRIDDPLPPQPSVDSKRQLHATISSLNRHQKRPLIRFTGDGTGTAVLWKLGSDVPAAGG